MYPKEKFYSVSADPVSESVSIIGNRIGTSLIDIICRTILWCFNIFLKVMANGVYD